MRNSIKVLVLCGGFSTEREVSLRSGKAVHAALLEAGFNAELLDINKDNVHKIADSRPDAVYIALHGKGGEDGQIQGMLEWMGIPYTGPGVTASAICIDKVLTKDILAAKGVVTPKYTVIEKNTDEVDVDALVKEFGLPIVVKAACQGSSIGVEIVKDIDRLEGAIREIKAYNDDILIEQYVSGREFSVPIIGNRELTVLPVIEIISENEFYDYESKYTAGMSHHIIPARISDELSNAVAEEAKKAFVATGCCGISRVDVIVGDDGVPYVIEINTAPGMTEMSLVPDAAAHAGISYPQLVTRLIEYAIEDNK